MGVQWSDVIICKTRKLSWFMQGMSNRVLNIGLVEETLLALCLVYVPFLQIPFKTAHHVDGKELKYGGPMPPWGWLYPLPFVVVIVIYDEIRKWIIRKYPNGCVQKYTY